MSLDLGQLLGGLLGTGAGAPPADVSADQFHQVAQAAPADLLSQGLAAMFRSDQTPAFGQLAGQLFGQASPEQQAGMLNHLLAGASPALLASLLGGAGAALAGAAGDAGRANVTPDQAAQLSPQQFQQMAAQAEAQNPGIVDRMARFYADHSSLVKTLGGAALTVVLAKMAQHQREG